MRESDIVRTITIRHKAEGSEQAKSSLQGVAAAQDKLAQSSQNLAQVSETSARRQASVARQFDAMAMRADPARKAIEELNRAHKVLQSGVDQNSSRLNVANATLQTYVEKANKAVEARNRLTAAERDAAMVTRNRINEVTGVTGMASRNPMGRAEDIAAYGQALNQVREKFNPLFAVGQQYRRTVEEINAATRAGALTEKERTAAMDIAKTTVQNQVHALRDGARAGRLMAGEMANLSFQLNDVVTGLALGQSPFMIMAQQGGQVYQILANSQGGVRGALKEIGSTLGGIVTPARLAMGAVAGLGVAALAIGSNWETAGRQIDQALIGVGRRTGETRASINKFSSDNSSLTGLSVAEARNVAIEFAKTGNLAASTLKGVGDAVRGYSILTGTDAADATKDLAGALSGDLVNAALKVDAVYGVMNGSTLESIRVLEMQGKRAEAVQIILDRMAAANQKAIESQGLFSRLGTGIANVASNIFNGAPASGASPQEVLANAQGRLATAEASPSPLARQGLEKIKQEVAEAQKALDSLNTEKASAALNKLSTDAFKISQAVLPQIDAIAKLNEAIAKMQGAVLRGVAPDNGREIVQVLEHQRSLQQDSLNVAVRQAQVAGQLRQAYGGVTTQTALALASLRDQLSVAQGVTGAAQMQARELATINNLLREGVSLEEAKKIAAQQTAVAQANATTAVMQQVQALKDQNAMIRARENGTEAQTAASIAYRTAMESGADSSAAAALKAETFKNHMLQASSAVGSIGIQLDNLDWSEFEAYAAAGGHRPDTVQSGAYSYLSDPSSEMGTMEVFVPSPFAQGTQQLQRMAAGDQAIPLGLRESLLSSGPINSDWQGNLGDVPMNFALRALEDLRGFVVDQRSAMTSAEAQFLGGSKDNADRIRGMELQIQLLEAGLERNPENVWQIRSLQRSIEELKNSTDALNETMSVTLNPLYNGRDALRVGYMGAANGLDMMVRGGVPGVDSVPIHIMAQQGERVQVTKAGEAKNDNSKVINNNFYFGGGSSSSRRSERQVAQGYAQTVAAFS